MNNIIVFYHAKDNDGLGSAWVAWKKFKDKADYFGIDYHFELKFDYRDKTIYFLDIHPTDAATSALKQNNNRLILIDHHLSTERVLSLYDEYRFDINHSAAVLSWKYFFPQKPMPKILTYVEDIDIWKHQIPFSREIDTILDVYANDFEQWDKLAKEIERPLKRKKYITMGQIITNYQDKLIDKIVNKAKLVKFEGYTVFAVNSPILISEVGNALVKKQPPLAIVWSEINHTIWFSLRSDDSCDASKIAEKYGGGGHKGAAAFYLKSGQSLPWQEIN